MTSHPPEPPSVTTVGELRTGPWAAHAGRSVRDELRTNLVARLRRGDDPFPGVIGYERTVVPRMSTALLAGHALILLGLRGQAKTRLLRAMTDLLDPWIPVLRDAELPDDPLAPVTLEARTLLKEQGDEAAVSWLPRERRYVEKLATPDVTVADLIGDVDPIKASRLGTRLGDPRSVHYGLLPRANRGIFAVNELPDLSGKVQVALFNVLQEGDVQIKGYPVRLPLDVMLAFSANPEDYTARGKIVTPLKDRIGSEIRTHYPGDLRAAVRITAQEARVRPSLPVRTADWLAEATEQVAFVAREDPRVDRHSGVSQRLAIALREAVVAEAERRALLAGRPVAYAGVHDLQAVLPAVTGKLELEYEGELKGAETVAREIVRDAIGRAFAERSGGLPVDAVVAWFDEDRVLRIDPDADPATALQEMAQVPSLLDVAAGVLAGEDETDDADEARVAAAVFALEGLHAAKRIGRSEELGYVAAAPSEEAVLGGRRWN